MAFGSYAETRPWAKSIRSAVASRKMPPFHAAGAVGRYVDDPRLTDEQIALIVDWVDRGCPPGAGESPEQEAAAAPAGGWKLGKPDLVLKIPPYRVKPSDSDDYRLHILDYQFPEETWIGAVEFRFSDPGAVHHTELHICTLSPREIENLALTRRTSIPFNLLGAPPIEGEQIAGWLPGQLPKRFEPGEVMKVEAGSRLALMNHYAPVEEGVDVVNKTQIGIHYFTGTISEERGLSKPPYLQPIRIQPGQSDFRLEYEDVIDRDALIDNYTLHMHMRGLSGRITLIYPDGRSEPIFEVPRYDFNWQRRYYLKDRIFAPAGTRVHHVGIWDNSAANPNNPDPSALVTLGFNSLQEMWSSAVRYVYTEPLKQPIRIVAGRRQS